MNRYGISMKLLTVLVTTMALSVGSFAALPITDGLVMHLDAGAIAGVSDGSPISTWTDLTGLGNHATQTTVDSQPTYVASNPMFKGYPTVRFDGTNDYLNLPSGTSAPINVGSFTLIAVARFDAVNRGQYLVSGQAGSSNDRLRIMVDWLNSYWAFHWRIGNTGWPGAINASPDTNVHIFGAGSGGGTAEGFLDGVSVGTASNTSTLQPSLFSIGSFRGTGSFFSGDVAEFILFDRKLTPEEYAQVNTYLMLKYVTTVTDPSPTDGATSVGLDADVILEWNAAPNPANPTQTDPRVKKHYVFMDMDNTDADPNLYYVGEVVITDWSTRAASFGPIPVTYDQNISWQIEEGLDDGLFGVYAPGDPNNWRGPIWSFTTLASTPVIDQQPQNTFFEAGDSEVVLTFTATTAFEPLTYQWYKNALPISDDAKYQGTRTNTLVILDPDINDEGGYYCRVTADNGGVTDSNIAVVKMKRLVAHYPFEQNADDAVGTNHGTVVGGLPYTSDVLVTVDGQGWAADPNGVGYVALPMDAYPRAGFGNALEEGTVSFWVKVTSTALQTILGTFNTGSTTGLDLGVPYTSGGEIRLFMRDTNGRWLECQTGNTSIADGQWHHIAVTYNANTGSGSSATIYFNGERAGTATGQLMDNQAAWEYPIILMGRNNRGNIDQRFSGVVDDLRIYNYALSFEEIATDYLPISGRDWVCNREFPLEFDFNDDCRVGLEDFAIFAAEWLSSNRFYAD